MTGRFLRSLYVGRMTEYLSGPVSLAISLLSPLPFLQPPVEHPSRSHITSAPRKPLGGGQVRRWGGLQIVGCGKWRAAHITAFQHTHGPLEAQCQTYRLM